MKIKYRIVPSNFLGRPTWDVQRKFFLFGWVSVEENISTKDRAEEIINHLRGIK